MSVDRLYVICGNCGHDATDGNFTWRHRPKEIYGNGEFNSADVFISCKNCGTLHSLGKYMQEESGGGEMINSEVYLTKDEIVHPYADLKTMIEDKRRKAEQMSKTLFHQITASPEVLAPKFVYYTVNRDQFGTYYWYCSALIPGEKWNEESDALAATVARLKEVIND